VPAGKFFNVEPREIYKVIKISQDWKARAWVRGMDFLETRSGKYMGVGIEQIPRKIRKDYGEKQK